MTREISVRNPRTGEDDHQIQVADAAELAGVCDRLRQNQRAWSEAGTEHRCRVLKAWSDALISRGDVAAALAVDTGRHLIAAVEVQALGGIVERWCSAAPGLLDVSGEWASATPGVGLRDQLVPYELVGVISPWNFPLLLSMLDVVPALVAGCSVVVKPSEVTPRFIEPLTASLDDYPELAGVLSVVTGDGATGAALIENVDAMAFTGSVATGRLVAESCARRFIPVFLELGGKDPAVVLPSANPVQAAKTVLRASVQATGQACQSLERVYVHESGFDAFVKALVEMAEAVELNYPDIRKGQIGPLIFDKQSEIISAHLDDARSKGATIHCGGIIETHGGGKWIRPTVLTGVDHSMRVMCEETFGPVMPVMAYRDLDEAIALANDTEFGLSAAVIGPDIDQAEYVARRINAGAVGINDGAMTVDVQDAPHDSFGFSGMGVSRMGSLGLMRYMRRKSIMIRHTEAKGVESLEESLIG
jgi:succinate-semialdehyde dehydrogenase/glutarate-semialdehyde dehydrogenase